MLSIKHIAVIVDFAADTEQGSHTGLSRAKDIAILFNAKVTLLSCVYQRSVEFIHLIKEIDEQTIKNETCELYRKKLNKLAKTIEINKNLTSEVIWHKHTSHGLTAYINQSDIDLVIKPTHKATLLEKLFTPLDWHLLRETKTAILFVKAGEWPKANNVLGAINIDSDPAHEKLNHKIIENCVHLAKLCGGQPHLLNVFPWPLIDLEQINHLINKQDHFTIIRDNHQQALVDYIKDQPIKPEWLHVAEGLTPEETIPEMIKTTDSSLLILGTVGRSGFKGITIGNTAEKILDKIQCEVLALK